MRYLLLAAALAMMLPAAADAQRRDTRDADEFASRIDTVLSLGKGGTVDLSLLSGDIIVDVSSSDQVRIRAYSERGILRLDAGTGRITLGVRSDRGRMGDTRFDVSVPAGTRVLASTVSGDVSVRGIKGEVEARSTSGSVTVSDAVERVTMVSISGDVRGARLAGSVSAHVTSGDLGLRDVTGDVEAESVSGDVRLEDVRSKWVRAETVSGDIDFVGDIDAAGRYEFQAHSGDLRLRLPDKTGATVTLQTFNGELDSAFPMTVRPMTGSDHGRPKRLEFTMGSGGGRIDLTTFSGNITIDRGLARGTPEN